MRKRRAYLIAIAVSVIILLGVAWGCYTYTERGYAPVYPNNIVSTSRTISQNELRAFLKTWHRYRQEGMDKLGFTELSLVTNSSPAQANPDLARWLERKGWDADRFFYIEERIRAIISTIKRDEQIAKNQKLMLQQAKAGGSSELSTALLKNAEAQNQKINIEKITSAERAMIKPQMQDIISLLKGEPN